MFLVLPRESYIAFMLVIRLAWCLLLLLAACSAPSGNSVTEISEASGVLRQKNSLLVVDDSVAGAYISVPIDGEKGPLIPLRRAGVRRIPLATHFLTPDLEGIDRLADGKLVFLSERLRSLVGEEGLIAEYDSLLGEFANRGLEGVAVCPLPGGVSRIAVIWEGGYPDYASVPWSVRGAAGRQAMRPLVVVHDLNPGVRGVELKMRDALLAVELEVPKPAGEEPEAQRFRAPDLVWTRWQNGSADDWSFLVLITSQNSVELPQYLYHCLQRFDLHGRALGGPLDLSLFLPQEVRHANWEGLSWFEKGKSLVLVHEGNRRMPPHAFILNLPDDWQYTPERIK
ncbi:MAG: hypothetical protein L0312_31965 [Acidobacteria bacterium]|nr:hypothetical protein [Acidobacteriota bacterium]